MFNRKDCGDLPSGSDDKGDLGLGVNEEGVSIGVGTSVSDLVGILLGILSGVLGSSVGSGLSGLSTVLLLISALFDGGSEDLGVSSLFLHNVLGNDSCPKTNK